MDLAHARLNSSYELEECYTREQGRVFLTGTQALVRLLLTQSRLDRAAGLHTAGFVSGYRGSPLAGLDKALWHAARHLEEAEVRFQPGVNEALAATAVFGSQQVESDPARRVDGVFGMWYGKGPGVDWAGDAIKHGNAYGSSPHGGVLLVAGDDHGAVSSTMSHQSDHTLAAWSLPVLNPASLADYLELGLYGWALSRFCGAWVGFKAIAETVESAASVVLPRHLPRFERPGDFEPPPGGLHLRPVDPPSTAIESRLEAKLAAARAFARANGVDRLTVDAPDAWLGIAAAGKAHGDLLEALRALGFTSPEAVARLGLRILQVRQSYPLEPEGMRRFAQGLELLLVLEEKRPFVELQVKDLLYNLPRAQRPLVLGKTDEKGATLLPSAAELRPHLIAPLLAHLLCRRIPQLDFASRLARPPQAAEAGEPRRVPWFCPGCPHNTSTRVPEGSTAAGGIGCHIMATWMPDRPTFGTTQMGGEGAQWTGLAPFTDRPHIFQNLGDGTFFHSGHLAIRQAVAAGTRITFKILYNDAVAMTGGQPHDGPLSVPQITRQVFEEGVRRIALVSDEPEKHAARDLAPGVTVHHRSELDAVQRELRDYPGVSVLVYDQTCAAEKRRRRKKGTYPDPQRRAFINELVCEGCGDCSRTSNCLAVVPLPTEFGTKRAIDQSACNKDFSCVDGFCPSFVTIEGPGLRRVAGIAAGGPALTAAIAALPLPQTASGRACNMLVAGIGGTGVLTIGAVTAMAAHLEGREVTVLDFTGLAQKGGAVLSHIRVAAPGTVIGASRIEPGEADLLLGCDLVVASGAETRSLLRPGTGRVVANGELQPTADFIRTAGQTLAAGDRVRALAAALGPDRIDVVDATRLAMRVTGDAIGANMLLLGAAWQKGLVPVSRAAIDRAIELNGVAVEANRTAFAVGRLAAHDPDAAARLLDVPVREPAPEESPLEVLVARRRAFLEAYQDRAWADRYASLVAEVEAAERRLARRGDALARAVATSLFRLMSYKDEYEVARLYTEGTFAARLGETFAEGSRVFVHLAPPLLARPGKDGRPRKMRFGPWMLRAMRLLRHGKRLRGTALDPFGRTAERRAERALIGEYEALVREVLTGLRPDNHRLAVRIAALADGIRGFGPVKAASLERYRRDLAPLLDRFLHEPAMPMAAE